MVFGRPHSGIIGAQQTGQHEMGDVQIGNLRWLYHSSGPNRVTLLDTSRLQWCESKSDLFVLHVVNVANQYQTRSFLRVVCCLSVNRRLNLVDGSVRQVRQRTPWENPNAQLLQ